MKKPFYLLLIFVCCCFGHWAAAQPTLKIDSLKKVLATETVDAATLKKYLVLAVSKLKTNNTTARLTILDWLIDVCKGKKPFEQMEANAYFWKGTVYEANGNNDKAIDWYLKSLEFSKSIGYAYIENNANIGLGNFYYYNKQYDKSLLYYNNVVEVSKKNNFPAALASAYLNIANVISSKEDLKAKPDYTEIVRYMKLAAEVATPRNDTAILVKAFIGLGAQYNLLKDYAQAEAYMKKAEPFIALPLWEHLGANFYGNLGEIYRVQKKYQPAIDASLKALEIIKKYPDPNFQHEIYGSLSASYQALADYENAYKWQMQYARLKDSLEDKENFATMAELENKYQQAVKDKEIARLQTEQQLKQLELEKQTAIISGNTLLAKQKEDEIKLLSQKKVLQDLELQQQNQLLAKNKLQAKADSQALQLSKNEAILKGDQIAAQNRTRNFLIGGIALLALLTFFLYRYYVAKKRAYVQLQAKSQQIREQALQLSKQAKQIAQFQSQMNPHFVYNALHNIQGLVLNDEKQKANKQIQSLAQLMRKTFANAEKDDIPVEEEITYLHKYIEFEKAAIDSSLHFEVAVSKDAEGALIPPMMIQPFIENAIKHAELKTVANPYIKVLIETENNLLAINVKDNGSGIKKDISAPEKLSHSMSVIKSRLDLIFNGKADVNSQPIFSIKTVPELAEGTSIKFYLPLNFSY